MAVRRKQRLSLTEAVAMAVGTMIGASIFSILGVGVQIAGRNLPEALLLAGGYALAVAYSYAKLGGKIISNAGPIAFIRTGLGDNILTGALSILMWLTYVISIALFAKSFGGYFLPLFRLPQTPLAMNLVAVGIVAAFTALNFFGSKAVGRAEMWMVLFKLGVLLLFGIAGVFTVEWASIQPQWDGQHVQGMLSASVIFFLSYMGFGLITNASENIEQPEKNVPRAIYLSIALVMLVYISIAVVTLGNLPVEEIVKARDHALAVAAEPFLGPWGFVLVSLGALVSIATALNATLYGGANVAYALARSGTLPAVFERKVWFQSVEGLYITAGLSLTFAVLLNLESVASLVSIVFTVIYLFVIVAHLRLRHRYGGRKGLLLFHFLILSAVFLLLLSYQWTTQPRAFWGSWLVFLGALGVEYLYRKATKREIQQIRRIAKEA